MREFKTMISIIEQAIQSIKNEEQKNDATIFFDKMPYLESSFNLKKNEYIAQSTNPVNRSKNIYKVFEVDDKICFSSEHKTSQNEVKRFVFSVNENGEVKILKQEFFRDTKRKELAHTFLNGQIVCIEKFINNPHKDFCTVSKIYLKNGNSFLGNKDIIMKKDKSKKSIRYFGSIKENEVLSFDLLNDKNINLHYFNMQRKTALK